MSNDTPDTPPEVLARQANSRALTPETADLVGQKEYMDQSGRVVGITRHVLESSTKKARAAAEEFMGSTPLMGMSEEEVRAVKNKEYTGAPPMGPIGDRTPAFVNWLWNNHPSDAAKRYAYRDIWPTKFQPVTTITAQVGSGPVQKMAPVPQIKIRRKRGPNKPKPALQTPATA